MATHRLLEALNRIDSAEAERLFGSEAALAAPDPTVDLAPVRRVAIFTESFLPKVDGVSKTTYMTLRYLQQTGREVIVFAPDTAPNSINGSRVVPLPSLGIPVAPETRMALPNPMIASHLDAFKPDLIHLCSPAVLCVHGMILGRQRGIPVIANYQTDLPGYAGDYGLGLLTQFARDWLRFIHNGSHLTLVPSTYTMEQLRSWGYHRLRRWARGVDNRRFNPARRSEAMRARLLNGRDPNSLLCIYVGRLANEKRVDLLLDVARTPGVALTVIGDGAQRSDLETLFAGTGTHFTGYLFGDDLADAYASADVFMFAGTRETFGQVLQEAHASGLPTVVVKDGGVTDLVEEGVNGFIRPVDPKALAQVAVMLRDDPALRRRISENARRMVEAKSWEAILSQLETHYAEAVALNERMNHIYRPSTWLTLPSIPELIHRVRSA